MFLFLVSKCHNALLRIKIAKFRSMFCQAESQTRNQIRIRSRRVKAILQFSADEVA